VQCVSCQFFNVPGSAACGRCGTTLRFDELDIATEPPRAPKGGVLPRLMGRQRWSRFRADLTMTGLAFHPLLHGLFGHDLPPLREWLRMLVPGWPLRSIGQTTIGWGVLAGWLLLVALSILFIGTHFGGLFLGLAFALHFASGLATFRLAGRQRLHLFRAAALLVLLLVVTLYLPFPWLFQRFVAQPVTVNRDIGPFEQDDVILYSPLSTRAAPGDWVMFEVSERRTIQAGARQVNAYVYPGQYMARVLARPGDLVEWNGSELRVNGEPAVWQPAGDRADRRPQKTTVPQDMYFVAPWVPDVIGYNVPNMPGLATGPISLKDSTLYVSRSQVQGRVFYRLHPISKMGRVR
jgi:hypothetical protein